MPKINNKNELTINILYWGPGGAGKAKILTYLYKMANDKDLVTPIDELATISEGSTTHFTKLKLVDNEKYFSQLKPKENELFSSGKDFLRNSEFSDVFFNLYSVGGNPAHQKQRKKNFNGVDGIVLVMDALKSHWEDNINSLKELKGIAGTNLVKKIPLIIMLNKIDLDNRYTKSKVKSLLKDEGLIVDSGNDNYMWNPPIFESCANLGKEKGIVEAFYEIIRRSSLYLKYGKLKLPRGEETIRINLTLPESLKKEWEGFAKKTLKISLSQMIRDSVREKRENYRNKSISKAAQIDPIDEKIEKIISEKFREFRELLKKSN
jgi:signal recognition particle receptor subunit beta